MASLLMNGTPETQKPSYLTATITMSHSATRLSQSLWTLSFPSLSRDRYGFFNLQQEIAVN